MTARWRETINIEDCPAPLKDADTIARLGRPPAVTLVVATQRPTQKVMGARR